VLAFGTQVCGFKPGQSRRIFKGEKFLSTPSFGGEVKPSVPCRSGFAACQRSLNVAWKSTFRQNYRTVLAHKFHLSLLGSIASCGHGDTWRQKRERPTLGGVQGCTISLQAAVHPRRTPQALIEKKKKRKKKKNATFC
jgi:hypothetical protein